MAKHAAHVQCLSVLKQHKCDHCCSTAPYSKVIKGALHQSWQIRVPWEQHLRFDADPLHYEKPITAQLSYTSYIVHTCNGAGGPSATVTSPELKVSRTGICITRKSLSMQARHAYRCSLNTHRRNPSFVPNRLQFVSHVSVSKDCFRQPHDAFRTRSVQRARGALLLISLMQSVWFQSRYSIYTLASFIHADRVLPGL